MTNAELAPSPLDVPLGTPGRPTRRGRLHLLALWPAIPLVVLLAVAANGAQARAGAIVYGVGLCSVLAVSTTYHRWVHSHRARSAWRRADHATIFSLIAGTCTALAFASLGTGAAIAMIVVIWFAAVTGAVLKVARFERADRLGSVMYVVMGWSGAALVPAIWQRGGLIPVLCLVMGGIAYTVGAACFAHGWPRLAPERFSYHEVWHAFTLAAAGLHFTAITTLAT